jgi:hypothetical protein
VGNTVFVGNSTVNATVNSTIYTGTSYNSVQFDGRGSSSYVNTSGIYTISGVHTHTANTIFAANLIVNSVISIANTINLNGSNGTAGQVLTSNGNSNAYWSKAVNTDAQYIWTNTTVFTNSVSIASAFSANGSNGAADQVLVSAGPGATYWKNSVNSNTAAGVGGVQYHNGTTFGSNAGLTFSAGSNNLSVANSIVLNGVTVNSTSFPGTANSATYFGGALPSSYVNTSADYTFTGIHTFSANIVIGNSTRIQAGGQVGTIGQLLTSNGTTVIWANPVAIGTVTSVAAGNGISTASGSAITGSGTVYVNAGNGLISDSGSLRFKPGNSSIISNTTGVFVTSLDWATLTNKPSFFSGSYVDLTNKPTIFSGNYVDLTNKPTIPTATSQLTNDSGYVGTAGLSSYALKATPTFTGLTTVAGLRITGSYYTSITALGSGTSFAVNCSLGNYFTATSTGTTSISFSSAPASGNLYSMIIRLTGGGNYTVAWPSSVKWQGAVAPTPTTNTDIWVFSTDDGGTSWRGNLTLKDYR